MAPTATAERKRTKKAGGKPARGRKPRERQSRLPGMERPSNPTIDRAADEYVEARDERMKLTKRELETGDRLKLLMKEHDLRTYENDDLEISFDVSEKVKVKRRKDEAATDTDAEE